MQESKNIKNNNTANNVTVVLFVIYLIATFWILVFKLGVQFSYMENRQVNLIPFMQAISNGNIDLGETIMNMVIFVPLGIYAGVLFKEWIFLKKIFFFLGVSLFVEAVQFIFRVGAFDTTDTINNTLGGMIGLMIFKGIGIMYKEPLKAQKFINIVASVGTFLMIVFLFLLKTNNLGVRYQ